jgi:outer membrane protein assembly factor BamB
MEIKFGWMEIMDALHWLNQNHELAIKGFHEAIIPMVLIPLTAVTVMLTSIAGIIAGWFGIKLHTEGPKQFLEVLLKKRVLVSMILFNLLGVGIYKGYIYTKNLPSFLITIKRQSEINKLESLDLYHDSLTRKHEYIGEFAPTHFSHMNLINEVKFNKGSFRSGVISNESLFYGNDDGFIYELDKNNLKIKRKFFIGTQVTTRPVIFENKIFVGEGNHETHHARIYSFDLKSGKYKDSFTTKGHTEGQPYIGTFKDKSLVFITAGSDGLYALDPESLKEVWHKNDGHLDATVSIEDNRVYIGTGIEKENNRDRSFAINYDFLTGKMNWKKELPLSNWMHPILTSTDVCYVLGEIYFPSTVGLLYCLNKLNGTPHFSIPFDSPIASKPFYIHSKNNEYAFFATFNGEICGVDLLKKEKMWCHQTGSKTTDYSLASVDYDSNRNILWYPSLDNGIFAFEPVSGRELIHWMPKTNGAKWQDNYASVSIDGDILYLMDIAGNLRKFKIE